MIITLGRNTKLRLLQSKAIHLTAFSVPPSATEAIEHGAEVLQQFASCRYVLLLLCAEPFSKRGNSWQRLCTVHWPMAALLKVLSEGHLLILYLLCLPRVCFFFFFFKIGWKGTYGEQELVKGYQ